MFEWHFNDIHSIEQLRVNKNFYRENTSKIKSIRCKEQDFFIKQWHALPRQSKAKLMLLF